MALVPAIQFGDLAAQLTVEETKQFIKDFAVSHPQLIIQLLSLRFINQSTVGNDDTLNVQCNESISNIIRSRDTDHNKSEFTTFDALPHILIGHCGSFLDQKSYGALSKCNRTTYLGTHSPIMLKELTVCYSALSERNHLPLDLSSFSMTSTLFLKIPKLDMTDMCPKGENARPRLVEKVKIFASEIVQMPHLESLNLYGLGMNHELIEIIANHQRTNQNVRCVGLPYDSMSSLTAFKNLEFLNLEMRDHNASATVSEIDTIKQTLIGLKGLKLMDYNSPFGLQLLQSIGHQLQYLELHYFGCGTGRSTVNLQNTNFRNLKQFIVGIDCVRELRGDILKTATNLEKAKIDFYHDYVDGESSCITELIGNCEKLEYLEIVNGGGIDEILDATNHGLFRSRKCERKILKICIDACMNPEKNEEILAMKFEQTIHQLQISKVEQWMILLRRYTVTNVIKKLIGSLTGDVRIVEDKGSDLVVISNPDCTINGYSEQWLMSPEELYSYPQ